MPPFFSNSAARCAPAEVLSGSMERIVRDLNFSGRVSVIIHNGRILKSGYEEGYFTRRDDARLL